jgi:hypothetical protein
MNKIPGARNGLRFASTIRDRIGAGTPTGRCVKRRRARHSGASRWRDEGARLLPLIQVNAGRAGNP